MARDTEKKATYLIQGYVAVIPKIQNVYHAEEARRVGWEMGFKYESGIFEFFNFKTKIEAEVVVVKLINAIERYYG